MEYFCNILHVTSENKMKPVFIRYLMTSEHKNQKQDHRNFILLINLSIIYIQTTSTYVKISLFSELKVL